MNGYSSHTFKWVNAEGAVHYVKYHFKTEKDNMNHGQIISTKEALPSHFLDIATDLLLSTLCESTLKLFFSGVMIIQEILSSTRAMSIMTFQLFRLPLEHEV